MCTELRRVILAAAAAVLAASGCTGESTGQAVPGTPTASLERVSPTPRSGQNDLTPSLTATEETGKATQPSGRPSRGLVPASADILRYRVSNGASIDIMIWLRDFEGGEYFSGNFLDTGHSSRPDFFVAATNQQPGVSVYEVSGFARARVKRQPCTDARHTFSKTAEWVRIAVPAECLGDPAEVRVNVGMKVFDARGEEVGDDAPGGRHLSKWVKRGTRAP